MRLDVFLKKSCLVTRRSVANELVKVNNNVAKPAKEVKVGDEIELKRGRKLMRIRILALPEKQVSKKQAHQLYEILSEQLISDDLWS